MANTFSGLEIGRRALSYFRQGIETAGHNMSNADVKGYSRQRVDASATTPFTAPGINSGGQPGQIGTGVGIDGINRIRDEFLDAQFRQESIDGGFWEAASKSMEYIEMFLGEPSENGLSGMLEKLNQSLQELQKRPDSSTARESFVRELDNLCNLVNHTWRNLEEYRTSLNQELELKVDEANGLIDRIASLNGQIETIKALGNSPNDLMDRRDVLIEDLSRLADISVSSNTGRGSLDVSIGGKVLVQHTETRHLVLVPQEGNGGLFDVQVAENEFEASSRPGVATAAIGRSAKKGIYNLEVSRMATQTRWSIGNDSGDLGYKSQDSSLGFEGAFSLQVGTNGFKAVSSKINGGELLTAPGPGELQKYSLRLAAGTEENILDIAWDETGGAGGTGEWTIDGNGGFGGELSLHELEGYINADTSGDIPLNATLSDSGERITLYSDKGNLVSITDISGDLSSKLGLGKPYPATDIEITENDSLQTIANKINGAFDPSEGGADGAQGWLHATVKEAVDGSFYLNLESNAVGEAYRINVSASEGRSLEAARRLGLVEDKSGVSSIINHSADALFKVKGMEYLSSSNTFSEARLVTSFNSFRADTLQKVIGDVNLELKGTGVTDIRVERHITGGFIEGLLHSRDDLVTGATDFLDDFAMTLSEKLNAIHYGGHGSGQENGTTGTALLEPLGGLFGAASSLKLNGELLLNSDLIATAKGDGSGSSMGSGDGSKVLELLEIYSKPEFGRSSATIDEYYSSFIASIGTQSRQSRVMNENQETLLNQISSQRQSISGVNMDEEMMDIIQYQQSYQAISRYITVIDEMLDKVINGMGTVGR